MNAYGLTMSSYDARPTRRMVDRRQRERRDLSLLFNSPAWVDYVRQHYALWPKKDRREQDRRACDRRMHERRSLHRGLKKTPLPRGNVDLSLLLSDEEKLMIQQLFAVQD
jgi:hypothetical protein